MSTIHWKHPWRAVYDSSFNDEALSLQNTLERELSIAHPLFNLNPKVIGRSSASDEVVVSLKDGSLAFVHLTWQGKPDQYPEKFPAWSRIQTIEQFNGHIAQDAEEYEENDL